MSPSARRLVDNDPASDRTVVQFRCYDPGTRVITGPGGHRGADHDDGGRAPAGSVEGGTGDECALLADDVGALMRIDWQPILKNRRSYAKP